MKRQAVPLVALLAILCVVYSVNRWTQAGDAGADDKAFLVAGADIEQMYDDTKCITKTYGDAKCSLGLLTKYHEECGRFAGSTYWADIDAGYPTAQMIAQMCQMFAVEQAPSRLERYIKSRNITSVVTFGDSQSSKYHIAFLNIFRENGYSCRKTKYEPGGFVLSYDYYTSDLGVTIAENITRICRTCSSSLTFCKDKTGHSVRLEYVSLYMNAKQYVTVCKQGHGAENQRLCVNITQQEMVLKHYLSAHSPYPQLLFMFSSFSKDQFKSLRQSYDGTRYLFQLLAKHVPATSPIIWFSTTPWNIKTLNFTKAYEGQGYNPNEKLRRQNRFLASVLQHYIRETRGRRDRPPMYSFFDLYHIQSQLLEKWTFDYYHSQPQFYTYITRYIATVLPTLP